LRINEVVRRFMISKGDMREVITDEHAPYFGAELDDESLVAGPNARLGAKRFDEWLKEATK
jgi:hypothetical protein